MLTDKHVIVAVLVTPILGILAWFAVGSVVGEKPRRAMPGQSYPLVERSNCRYDSGQCDLRNEDLQLIIRYEESPTGDALTLASSHPLDGVLLAATVGAEGEQAGAMRRQDSTGQRWRLLLREIPPREARLRVAVQSDGSQWFAETSTAFLERYREPIVGE